MYKLVGVSYNIDGKKLFSILDTSDNVKEKLTLSQVQRARLLGLKIEGLSKKEIYPLKTKKEIYQFWCGFSKSYIDSIISILEKASVGVSFPNTIRIYVQGWTKSDWFDCQVPKCLEVKCDSFIELVSYWFSFCKFSFIQLDLFEKVEVI